ncbi:MAG: hypothetical protein ACUZ8N_13830 [Candidatus Scalindua sp.]
MKGFWIIVVLIMVLVPLFMFSINKDKKIKKREEEVRETVPDIVDNTIYESVSKFRMHMKSLDEYDDALAESIECQNWGDICKYAMLLKSTSPLLFTGKRKVELPKDFIMFDTFFHFQSLAVVEAAESREMVSLNIEYEKLQQTCDDCHEKYKKKE